MRVLVVTNMYPTNTHPGSGTFIADQVESLRHAGEEIELLFVDRPHAGRHVYRELRESARHAADKSKPDLVHVMYGGVMADVVTRVIRERPVLVSFCGDDLLGNRGDGVLSSLTARCSPRGGDHRQVADPLGGPSATDRQVADVDRAERCRLLALRAEGPVR